MRVPNVEILKWASCSQEWLFSPGLREERAVGGESSSCHRGQSIDRIVLEMRTTYPGLMSIKTRPNPAIQLACIFSVLLWYWNQSFSIISWEKLLALCFDLYVLHWPRQWREIQIFLQFFGFEVAKMTFSHFSNNFILLDIIFIKTYQFYNWKSREKGQNR